jgi:prepilin-type N-terminal cleavage/methylation domain-containing protein
MPQRETQPQLRRGFTLAEVLTTLILLAVLIAAMSVMGNRSRKSAGLTGSIANLKMFADTHASYATDHGEQFAAFSVQPRQSEAYYQSVFPDRPGMSASDIRSHAFTGEPSDASAAQMEYILRSRGQRTDGLASNFVPQPLYSHLVLAEYLHAPLPLQWAISPGNAVRRCWAENSTDTCTIPWPSELSRWRWSSSYGYGMAFYAEDFAFGPGQNHNTFTVARGVLAGQLRSRVRDFSRKAMMWDEADYFHGSRVSYWRMPEARIPVMFADSSVRVYATGTMNLGWNPASANGGNFPASIRYSPSAWEPSVLPGQRVSVFGSIQYTRRGLLGRDVDGPEVWNP